jgi:hypothetical protein
VPFLKTKTAWNRIRITLPFLFLIASLGCPGKAAAAAIYLPFIIAEQGPLLKNGNFDLGPDGSWKRISPSFVWGRTS